MLELLSQLIKILSIWSIKGNKLDWLGNVRQPENICSWLTAMTHGQEVHPNELPAELVVASI